MARRKRGPKRSILKVCEHWAAAFDAARQPEAHCARWSDGAVAQLGERQLCKLDVVGSSPISSMGGFFEFVAL